MALFLTEAAKAFESSTGSSFKSLEEALFAQMDLQAEIHQFTESVMIAEYTLEMRSKNLSEGEAIDKAKAFAKKVWDGIKTLAAKVWARVKDTARLVARKISEYATKVFALFGEAGEVSEVAMYEASNLPRVLEVAIRLCETGFKDSEDADKQIAAFEKMKKDLLDKTPKDASKMVAVKKAVWEKLIKTITGLTSKLEAAAGKAEGAVAKDGAEAEKNPDKAKELAAIVRMQMKAGMEGMSLASKASSLATAFHGKKAEEKKA